MKKILIIIGGITISVVVLFILVFSVVSANSKKMVCTSDVGNITLMYNDNGLTGYTAVNISYDLDAQKKYAKQVGIEAYLTEFSIWFTSNTKGVCVR